MNDPFEVPKDMQEDSYLKFSRDLLMISKEFQEAVAKGVENVDLDATITALNRATEVATALKKFKTLPNDEFHSYMGDEFSFGIDKELNNSNKLI